MERKCDACGKIKNVSGAKICENGHFICYECYKLYKRCPICQKPAK
jgi:hypothetical protein